MAEKEVRDGLDRLEEGCRWSPDRRDRNEGSAPHRSSWLVALPTSDVFISRRISDESLNPKSLDAAGANPLPPIPFVWWPHQVSHAIPVPHPLSQSLPPPFIMYPRNFQVSEKKIMFRHELRAEIGVKMGKNEGRHLGPMGKTSSPEKAKNKILSFHVRHRLGISVLRSTRTRLRTPYRR